LKTKTTTNKQQNVYHNKSMQIPMNLLASFSLRVYNWCGNQQ